MVRHVHPLVSRFAEAGLRLHIAAAPLQRAGTAAIVQLDIARGRSKADEGFRLWPGHARNRIEVEGVDRGLEQLVLLIHEPRVRFEVEMDRRAAERSPELKVVRVSNRRAWVERFTDSSKRHFLCGMDEQHCFIAQLPEGVSTVRRAHEALRPAGLDAKAAQRAVRQGEFFFVPLSEPELKRCLQLGRGLLPKQNVGIAQAAGWVRAGRPHVASQVWALPEGIVLVQGQVRHPDHRTVYFREWMRVLQNREAYEAPPPGVLWVD